MEYNKTENYVRVVGEIVTNPKEKVLKKANGEESGRLTNMLVRTYLRPRTGIDRPVPVQHAVIAFNELSDKIQGALKKGDNVMILGYYKINIYKNDLGGSDRVSEIVVEEINKMIQ